MSGRVLLVEDDFSLRLGLSTSLRGRGYDVVAVGSAEEAQEAARTAPPDIVVLDWNLPGESGLALLERWRATGVTVPVILLTARDAVPDRVRGLDSGADDYVVKPFDTDELVSRIGARLRARPNTTATTANTLLIGGATIELARGVVRRGSKTYHLTTQEAAALAYLAARPGQTVERDDLLREVWNYRGGVVTRAVDNAILRLRAKVEPNPAEPRHILTVHGIGYRFEP